MGSDGSRHRSKSNVFIIGLPRARIKECRDHPFHCFVHPFRLRLVRGSHRYRVCFLLDRVDKLRIEPDSTAVYSLRVGHLESSRIVQQLHGLKILSHSVSLAPASLIRIASSVLHAWEMKTTTIAGVKILDKLVSGSIA
jgi:hypothetical protein